MTYRSKIDDGLKRLADGQSALSRVIAAFNGTESVLLLADSGVFQERTSPTTPAAAQDDPVGTWQDQTTNGNDYVSPNDTTRGLINISGGRTSVLTDGGNDRYEISSFVTTGTSSVFIGLKTTDADGSILAPATTGTDFLGTWSSGGVAASHGGAGSPTTYVDGSAIGSTRGDLNTAIVDGGYHLVEIRDVDLTSWSNLNLIGYGVSTLETGADIVAFAVCPSAVADAQRSSITKLFNQRMWKRPHRFVGYRKGIIAANGTANISYPAGTKSGDLVILVRVADERGGGEDIAAPGFTNQLVIIPPGPWTVVDKLVAGAESATSATPASTLRETAYILAAFRNVSTVANNTATSGTSNTITFNSITPASVPAFIVAVGAHDDDTGTTLTSGPSGYTSIFQNAGGAASASASVLLAHKLVETAGAETPGNAVVPTSDDYAGVVLALT